MATLQQLSQVCKRGLRQMIYSMRYLLIVGSFLLHRSFFGGYPWVNPHHVVQSTRARAGFDGYMLFPQVNRRRVRRHCLTQVRTFGRAETGRRAVRFYTSLYGFVSVLLPILRDAFGSAHLVFGRVDRVRAV